MDQDDKIEICFSYSHTDWVRIENALNATAVRKSTPKVVADVARKLRGEIASALLDND